MTRLEDLPLVAQSFLESSNRDHPKQVGGIHDEALDCLCLYSWPGDLRELREVMHLAHESCRGRLITFTDLPPVIHHAGKTAALSQQAQEKIVLDEFLAAIERELILRALKQADGNKAEAARLLGMTRARLYRRLVQLDLEADGTNGDRS